MRTVVSAQHMSDSSQPSTRMALLSAVCDALPEVVAGGSETDAHRAGLPALLGLVLRAVAAAGADGASLLLRLPCILARATDQLLDSGQVVAAVFGSDISMGVCASHACCATLRVQPAEGRHGGTRMLGPYSLYP